MKKIIIVNNNMKVGGVQKSLYNLLWSLDTEREYDVTLLLFRKTGPYADKLPPGVKIAECSGPFRYLGMSQSECAGSLKDRLTRGFLAALSRICGRSTVIRRMLTRELAFTGTYDCAIAYLHNGRREAFYGGVQEYVLERISAEKKIAFLHGDYRNCGADHAENRRILEKFDRIAACSDGCREVLVSALPHLAEKCITVRNCHRYDEIRTMAEDNPPVYDADAVNVITVSRLTHEKGLERAIEAAACAAEKGISVRLHIVGSGPMEEKLKELAMEKGMTQSVFFYGEQTNPYRYMKNADLLLMTSFHEAAPMVIDEAVSLGIPVLTAETTSSQEMVHGRHCGRVCPNTREGINEAFCSTAADREWLKTIKDALQGKEADNQTALAQFAAAVDN